MRIATVNVNGVRAALRKGMSDWLAEAQPDVVCMQEVRAPDDVVTDAFGDEWHIAQQASEIKGRSGVAILSRLPLADIVHGLGSALPEPTHSGRWVGATVTTPSGPLRVVSTYVHSGTAGTPSMDDKYAFMDVMTIRMAELNAQFDHAVVMGDINVAHTERDIRNWKGNLKSAGFLPEERAYLTRWLDSGWVDTHRVAEGDVDGPYTWWSMRGKAFDNDSGWRIDYQFATETLASTVSAVRVDRQPSWDSRWTDHAPLVVDYDL